MMNRSEKIICEQIINKVKNRKIVFWGGWNGNKIKELLENEYGIRTSFFISTKKEIVDNKEIFSMDKISGKSKEYYIIAEPNQNQNIDKMFIEHGYKLSDDVYFLHPKTRVYKRGTYEDEYGNRIDIQVDNCIVHVEGRNNLVKIGKIKNYENIKIVVGNNCILEVEDDVTFIREFTFFLRQITASHMVVPQIYVNRDCQFQGTGKITSFSGYVYINEKSTFGDNFYAVAGYGMEIHIGKDTMFSHNIALNAGDGHSIFDIESEKCINSVFHKEERDKQIYIDDHVWVGREVTILEKTKIGKGSIIGAKSFVKGECTNNCIYAGNPAKVVRKNIAWSRQPVSDSIKDCGEENINYSE